MEEWCAGRLLLDELAPGVSHHPGDDVAMSDARHLGHLGGHPFLGDEKGRVADESRGSGSRQMDRRYLPLDGQPSSPDQAFPPAELAESIPSHPVDGVPRTALRNRHRMASRSSVVPETFSP